MVNDKKPEVLFHYTNAESAKTILSNNTLKFTSVDKLNDPFELKINHEDLRVEEIGAVNKTEQYIKENTSVSCSSETPLNPLMWGHYGGNHSGIAIGLNVFSKRNFSLRSDCKKVKYEKIIPKITLEEVTILKQAVGENNRYHNDYNKIIYDIVSTKHENWKYEEEWRFFTFLESGEKELIVPMSDFGIKITELYLGLRATDETKKLASDYAKEKKIPIYKIEIHPTEYKFLSNQILT